MRGSSLPSLFVRPYWVPQLRRREEVPLRSHPDPAPPSAMSRVCVGLDLDTLFDSGHECATVQTRVRAIQDRLPDLRRRATDSYSRAQPYDSGLRDLGIIGSKKCPTAGEQQRTRREATGTRLSARAHYLSICLDTVISAPPTYLCGPALTHGGISRGAPYPRARPWLTLTHTYTQCSISLDLPPHHPISLIVPSGCCRTEHYHTYGELE